MDIYGRGYDPDYPVVCFDERPCQLIADVITPVPPSQGKPAKEDYHYERKGTCVVLMAVEPLTGKRIVEVCATKTKQDYARFMQRVAKAWSQAKKIILIQDNLNTHSPSSFYENMPPEKAFALMEKFDMVYTPKRASWLNMVEIEFSALSKQCLDRRIGDIDTLSKEVTTWVNQRVKDKVKIDWQFSIEKARKKFVNRYDEIIKN